MAGRKSISHFSGRLFVSRCVSRGKSAPKGDVSSGNIEKVVGENINVQQNIFLLQESFNSSGRFTSFGSAAYDDMLGKLGNLNNPVFHAYGNFAKEAPADANLTNEDADTQKSEVKLPETPEGIRDWYCNKLNEWERCFVQAAAVLHGAPVHRIRDAADTLYHPTVTITDNASVSKPHSSISEETLHTRLYMRTVDTEGAERLFWSDANASGLSTFASRLLPIIIRQSNLSATNQKGTHFLKQLEAWSTELSGECAWRALRALGGVWIKLDRSHFQQLVNEWRGSNDPDNWRRAATLLDGAYEVEYAEQGEQVNREINSFVLGLLALWTRHAHASFQENVGSTVAQAYGRIGQRSVTTALKGLEELLHYPLRRKNDSGVQMPLVVFVSATWSHVTLARFGYIRDVLQHVASIVEKYCYQRIPHQGSERLEYYAQCRFMLETMFHIFFLIASASLNGVKDNTRGDYKRDMMLPTHPLLPNAEGQDTLLASILSSEEGDLRQSIMTILCGAILEKNAEPAFFLLKIWAEIVLKETNTQRFMLRQAFIDFLVEFWDKGNHWCHRLTGVRECDYPDLFALSYREALQQWQLKKNDADAQRLSAFAKDVCKRLGI